MSEKPEFELLVDIHSREIFVYLWRMLGNNADAEDCLQDTYLRAYRAYSRLNDDANVRAWLYKIATNVAHTHFKRNRRISDHTSDLDPEKIQGEHQVSDQVERNISLEAVKTAVEALPHKQRAALIMRKYQEMPYCDIAFVLKTSEDAARANVYQALKKLRSRFAANREQT